MILPKKLGVILQKFMVNLGKNNMGKSSHVLLEDYPTEAVMGKDFWTEQGKEYCYKNSVFCDKKISLF